MENTDILQAWAPEKLSDFPTVALCQFHGGKLQIDSDFGKYYVKTTYSIPNYEITLIMRYFVSS